MYDNIYESRAPRRIILKEAWQGGQRDDSNTEEREHKVFSNEFGETRSDVRDGDTSPKVDFRIQGLPHSTVEQEDNTRKEKIKELIHQIESHLDRDALKADLMQTQAHNPLSEKSKNMIHVMGNVDVRGYS